jgi:catechol 2,3-dioxygenase-like lactoylglutathione lyase family enzyme
VGDDAYLGFCQRDDVRDGGRDGAPEQPPGVIFTVVTPEVDRWYDHLRQRGVVFEEPPALNHKYNIYHCFLRDPNGYLIEIQRFLDPAWAGARS